MARKTLAKRSMELTTPIYERAFLKVMGPKVKPEHTEVDKTDYNLLRRYFVYLDDEQRVSIDEEYLKELLTLPSTDLELMLKANKLGRFRRANKTIQAILVELTERSLLAEKI